MVKNRDTRKRRQKRYRSRTMKGGAFIQEELHQLENIGFNEYQIERLTDLGVSFNDVMQKVNTIMVQGTDGFHGNSDAMTEQVMDELLDQPIFENPNTQYNIPSYHDEENTQDSLHLPDLNTSNNIDMSGYTTHESETYNEYGGRKRRKTSKKRDRKKKRDEKKKRKTRKQRGGICFGSGVGSNSYDPNYSIYNTNILKLFPYKPN